MIVERNHEEVISSGNMETAQAQIAVTPEMFALLSSGIYENKIAAIVRELTCNGRDGQVFANNTEQPMVMHLPNSLEPWWSIRDYGTGLSHEQVMSMYVTYGMSTKGDSNDFIGAMGIGSKSPLSYTDSFMVTSYQDGTVRKYNIFMEGGIPKVSKMLESPTEEANGLEVMLQVRVEDYRTFADEAELFLKLFPNNVAVKGRLIDTEVSIDYHEGYQVTNDYPRGIYALMGGVAYRIADSYKSRIDGMDYVQTMILPFEIGELSVAASRETLSLDDKTVAALDKRVEFLNVTIKKNISDDIDACGTLHEALALAKSKYNFSFGYWNAPSLGWIEYKGLSFTKWKDHYKESKYQMRTFSNTYNGTPNDTTTYVGNMFPFNNSDKSLGVVIMNPDKKQGSIKTAKKYCVDKNITVLLINDETLRNELKDFYQCDIVNVTDVYDECFPKGDKTTTTRKYRKTSGLFKYTGSTFDWVEVSELEDDSKGYFLEVVRNKATMTQNGVVIFEENWMQLKGLVDEGVIPELYLVRKTGRKHLKGVTGMVELTGSILQKKVDTMFNHNTRKKISKYNYHRNTYHKPALRLHKDVVVALKDVAPAFNSFLTQAKFPAKLSNTVNKYNRLSGVLDSVLLVSLKPVKDISTRLSNVADNEREVVFNKYPLLKTVEDHQYPFNNQEMAVELIEYINSKK